MRFTPSSWVFNVLMNRKQQDYEHINLALMEACRVTVIWLKVDPRIAALRQVEKQDPMTEDLVRAHYLFGEYFREITVFDEVHAVRTDDRSVQETLVEIDRKLYHGPVR
jgi:hypothetical protein